MRSPLWTANPTLLDLWRPEDYRRGACPRRKYLGEESSGDGLDLHIHAPGQVMRSPPTMYREMDMVSWLEQPETEMKECR
jgi:hypothetical protein